MNSSKDNAIDALIAASLRMNNFKNEVTDEEATKYFKEEPDLTEEEKNLIDSIDILTYGKKQHKFSEKMMVQEEQPEYESSILALNRKNKKDVHVEEQLKEMEEKRQELRDKLKKKKKDGNTGNSEDSK